MSIKDLYEMIFYESPVTSSKYFKYHIVGYDVADCAEIMGCLVEGLLCNLLLSFSIETCDVEVELSYSIKGFIMLF